jgi:hypothetical protein
MMAKVDLSFEAQELPDKYPSIFGSPVWERIETMAEAPTVSIGRSTSAEA